MAHQLHSKQLFNNEVRLDVKETQDILNIYSKIAYIKIARDAFNSMILHCPPKIIFKNLHIVDPEELDILFELYWLPWHVANYDWDKCFGVTPWTIENIRGTDHKIPVCPPFGAGYLTTFLDEKHHQQFNYYWNDCDKPASNFYFEVGSHPPGLDGKHRSLVASLLDDWNTITIIRQAHEMASYQQARQQHIFEFHPPKNGIDENSMSNLEAFGDDIAGTVMSQQENLSEKKASYKTEFLKAMTRQVTAANRGMREKYGSKQYSSSDKKSDQWERNNASLVSRGVPLPADYVYKSVPAPNVTAKLKDLVDRMDRMGSSIMDIPIALIESTGSRTTASTQGHLRFVNERIKSWLNRYKKSTKKAFLLIYGKMVQETLNVMASVLSPQKMLIMYADVEFEVSMPCTPISNVSDIKELNDAGFMNDQTAAEHMFNILGIPESDIDLSERKKRKIDNVATSSKLDSDLF